MDQQEGGVIKGATLGIKTATEEVARADGRMTASNVTAGMTERRMTAARTDPTTEEEVVSEAISSAITAERPAT